MIASPLGARVLACALLTAGCTADPPGIPSVPRLRADVPLVADPRAVPSSEPLGPARAPEPPPLPEARVVRVRTADGLTLVGDLRAGESPEASLVVLLHQLGSTRAEWELLARHLARAPALTTFAYDLRGHGESTRRARGPELALAALEARDFELFERDLRAVIDALLEQESLTPAEVIVVGSSIGSSVAVRAAVEDPRITRVVALSPGRAYRGLDALTPLTRFEGRRLLAIAAEGDVASAEAAQLMGRVPSHGDAAIVTGDAHGVTILGQDAESLERVLAFTRAGPDDE